MSQPLFSLLGELRAPSEWLAGLVPLPALPEGDGHAVIILPGLGTNDTATLPLQLRLKGLGYRVQGWGLGLNRGMRPHVIQQINQLIQRTHEDAGPVSLVGWSLGGIFARESARRAPDEIRQVITLGSPFGGSTGSNVAKALRMITGKRLPAEDERKRTRLLDAPPVPTTAIYSRSDGLVPWRHCLERRRGHTDNIRIEGSHGGLCGHPLAHYAIADRLAQPAGEWRPFHREGWRALAYGRPDWQPG